MDPHKNSWPDAGLSPFRGEKVTGWEGGFRSPTMVRWPGKIKPGQVVTDIASNLDWMPTLLAAVGEPDIKSKLLKGHSGTGSRARGILSPRPRGSAASSSDALAFRNSACRGR